MLIHISSFLTLVSTDREKGIIRNCLFEINRQEIFYEIQEFSSLTRKANGKVYTIKYELLQGKTTVLIKIESNCRRVIKWEIKK